MVKQYRVNGGKRFSLLTTRRLSICFLVVGVMCIGNLGPIVVTKRNDRPQSQTTTPSLKTEASSSITADTDQTIPSSSWLATETTTSNASSMSIDIISIGTLHQPAYQEAQQRTFGSHPHVRHFFRITELNDTESTCHTHLQMNDTGNNIVQFCRQPKLEFPLLNRLRHVFMKRSELSMKRNAAGWICAQKRCVDGVLLALRQYQQQQRDSNDGTKTTFPDYLVIVDDDSYLNMDLFGPHLQSQYPADTPHAVAGCLIRLRHGFSLPFGGFSYTLSRTALQNFVRPIYCDKVTSGEDADDDDNAFVQNACKRVKENQVGEGTLFSEGMSVADLLYAYTFDQPFLDVDNWNNVGFCMHSDMVMSYFIQYYNIPVHSDDPVFADVASDRFRAYKDSVWYRGSKRASHMAQRGECSHIKENCRSDSHICHYIPPENMEALYRKKLGQIHDEFDKRKIMNEN